MQETGPGINTTPDILIVLFMLSYILQIFYYKRCMCGLIRKFYVKNEEVERVCSAFFLI